MNTGYFEIEIIKQGWIEVEGAIPDEDLCSHGEIRLVIGGQFISLPENDYGISVSALALLRTLGSNHSPQQPVAENLIMCGCGGPTMLSCPVGIDWTVEHLG